MFEKSYLGIRLKELKFFGAMFLVLFVWFEFGLNAVTPYLQGNFIVIYVAFLFIYSFVSFKYILNLGNPEKNLMLFFAFVLVVLVGDDLFPPYLVSPLSCAVSNSPAATFSSDVLICTLLQPLGLGPNVNYILTYPIAITLGFLFARMLAGKKKFGTIEREAF